jgi:hypothetical protein
MPTTLKAKPPYSWGVCPQIHQIPDTARIPFIEMLNMHPQKSNSVLYKNISQRATTYPSGNI